MKIKRRAPRQGALTHGTRKSGKPTLVDFLIDGVPYYFWRCYPCKIQSVRLDTDKNYVAGIMRLHHQHTHLGLPLGSAPVAEQPKVKRKIKRKKK
jgi:hypothetical protein